MNNVNEFYDGLVEALAAKADNLEHTAIRKLREHLQSFEASASAIYDFLIDKGLMQNDPYKHERTVTNIQVPSSDPFSETDALHEISLRFSQYVSQWEFLVNIFHVSLPNLSLNKVRRLMELLDWIRWSDFSANSSFQVTRAVAQIVGKTTAMNDPMAGKIMTSSAAHLRELTSLIKADLKTITVFLRERYKWRVRDELTKNMNIDPELYRRNPQSVMNNVKFEFSHNLKQLGWYKDLIHELLEEDYGETSQKSREAVLERLQVSRIETKKKKRHGPDDKTSLLGVMDRLARTGEPIRSTLVKLNGNSRIFQERKKSIGERLSEILSNLFSKGNDGIRYEIPIKDSVTGSVKIEAIDFSKFSSAAMKKARILQELQDSHSVAYKNARNAEAAQLLSFIQKNVQETKNLHKRLTGLDEFFRSDAVPDDIRDSMKPSTLSLKNLKASIGETMKAMNEFKVRKEEEAQLRKLGIEDE